MDYTVKRLRENLYVLSLRDTDVNYFEAAREIGHEGILYNAYVIDTPEGAILVDGWKKGYEKAFEYALEEAIGDKPIKAYIVNHSEPDHTGTFPMIVHRYKPKVFASTFAHKLLKNFYGINYEAYTVKNGETVEILGEKFTFFHAPRLHRPDTIITERNGIRFAGDIFGSYYAYADPVYYPRKEPDPDTGEPTDVLEIYKEEAAEYFATVIGLYRKHGITVLKLVEERKPQAIAPAHGLIRLDNVEKPIEIYRELILGEPMENSILLLCSSMYGFTKRVCEMAREVVEDYGFGIRYFEINDRALPRIPDVLGNAYLSKAVILVSSAYEAGLHPRVRFILELMSHKTPARPMLVLMSFGRGATFDKDLEEMLHKAGFKLEVERFSIGRIDEDRLKARISEFLKLIERVLRA